MVPHLVSVGHSRSQVVGAFTFAASLLLAAGAIRPAEAQLVTPKTVPVFQNQQFDILPSATAGMAGLSIALDDSLADPFVSPAKATRLRGGSFFSAPFSHTISGNRRRKDFPRRRRGIVRRLVRRRCLRDAAARPRRAHELHGCHQ